MIPLISRKESDHRRWGSATAVQRVARKGQAQRSQICAHEKGVPEKRTEAGHREQSQNSISTASANSAQEATGKLESNQIEVVVKDTIPQQAHLGITYL